MMVGGRRYPPPPDSGASRNDGLGGMTVGGVGMTGFDDTPRIKMNGAGDGAPAPWWRPQCGGRGGLFQVVAEFAGAGGVAEFADGFGLDLADALAGYAEFAADFLQGAGAAVLQAEPEFEDAAFPVG